MVGRTEIREDNKKTNFTKFDKGQEIVKSNNTPRLEWIRHTEEKLLCI